MPKTCKPFSLLADIYFVHTLTTLCVVEILKLKRVNQNKRLAVNRYVWKRIPRFEEKRTLFKRFWKAIEMGRGYGVKRKGCEVR